MKVAVTIEKFACFRFSRVSFIIALSSESTLMASAVKQPQSTKLINSLLPVLYIALLSMNKASKSMNAVMSVMPNFCEKHRQKVSAIFE